jgi:RND family efflux transporter MFP subunit
MLLRRAVIGSHILLTALLAAGCTHSTPPSVSAEPPLVAVARPVESAVTDYVDYTGRTEAKDFVEVRARVSGYLVKVDFKEGQEVKAGAVIDQIDPRPYQAALEQAEAQIKVAEAKLKQAAADVERNRRLVGTGAIAKADFDKIVADAEVAAAAVAANKANAEAARLDLGYCKVLAPIDGRASRKMVTEGNLVAKDSTVLTTIVSQDPIYVSFDIDERTVLRILELIRTGQFKSARTYDNVPVLVGLANEEGHPHQGVVNFVDNRIEPGTGTIKIRATLPNPVLTQDTRRFTAGLFVRVRVPLGEPYKSLVVSERALGTDQGQKFLYVVNKVGGKDVVEYRPVAVGAPQKGGLRVVYPVKLARAKDGLRLARPDETEAVEDSLKPTDWVIVNGLQRVRPGLEVRTNEVPMPTALPLLEAKAVRATADAK